VSAGSGRIASFLEPGKGSQSGLPDEGQRTFLSRCRFPSTYGRIQDSVDMNHRASPAAAGSILPQVLRKTISCPRQHAVFMFLVNRAEPCTGIDDLPHVPAPSRRASCPSGSSPPQTEASIRQGGVEGRMEMLVKERPPPSFHIAYSISSLASCSNRLPPFAVGRIAGTTGSSGRRWNVGGGHRCQWHGSAGYQKHEYGHVDGGQEMVLRRT